MLVLQLCKKKFQLIADSGLDASETETTSPAAAAVTDVAVKKGKQSKNQVVQQQQEAAAAETAKQQEMEDREVSATEMRAEVATLIAEIFKGLSSPVIALRPVALSALLCITRAAVSTANTDPDCRATIASSLRAALVEFASKKNSRLAPKIFEELVSRYPEFCVLSFLPDLISSCESAKSAFLRAECCRFLTCILKRHKSLQGKALEVMDASLKNMVRTLGRALCSNCSSSSSSLALQENTEKGDKADKNKKSKKEAAVADAAAVTEIASSSNIATEGKSKEKETRAKRLKPLLLCTKELAHLLKLGVAGEVPGKAGGVNSQALAALLAVMRSEGLTDSTNNPAIVRMVDQVVTLINSTGASSSGSSSSSSGSVEVKSVTKEKSAGVSAAAAVVKVSKKEMKQKKEKDDGMVMGEGEAEEEDVYDDDALPIGEYVEAGAAGPKFKKKKGNKVVEAKEDKQETLDIAEKQVLKRMHADKRYRDEAEDVQTREDVGQKKKWHE